MVVVENPSTVRIEGVVSVFGGVDIIQTVYLLLDVVHILVLNLGVQVQKLQDLQFGQDVLTSLNGESLYALCLVLLPLDVHFHLNYWHSTLY